MTLDGKMSRRAMMKQSLACIGLSTVSLGGAIAMPREQPGSFQLNYICASAMFGQMKLSEILPEVRKTGADSIDLWPTPHGSQYEEALAMGSEKFAEMLADHEVTLGGIASYKFGYRKLKPVMEFAKAAGGKDVAIVCTGGGPRNLAGDELKRAVGKLVEQLQSQQEEAAAHGCLIVIENHSNSIISSVDSMKWFCEMTSEMPGVGLAFAPHHLPQDAEMQAELISALGPAIKFFYAQQHGKGSSKKMAKEDELLQMPGRGPLDFSPLVKALREIEFKGLTEIFMHSFPRGVPILDTADAITAEINHSRDYLESSLTDKD